MNRTLEYLAEVNPDAAYPTGMEEAIIGTVERFNQEPLVLLDRRKCIDILARDMGLEEAAEYFEYNVIGAWIGDGTPCFATLDQDNFKEEGSYANDRRKNTGPQGNLPVRREDEEDHQPESKSSPEET